MQTDNLRGLLSIRKMDREPNARIRELCRTVKGLTQLFSDTSAILTEQEVTGLVEGGM